MGSLRWNDGKLYSGGKDGRIQIINSSTLQVENSIDFGGVLIRAIDVNNGRGLVGLRNGSIYTVDMSTGAKSLVMQSHSDGEVWGLDLAGDKVLTTGDDN